MDIEFHYYMTYLISKRAGFTNSDSRILACASQLVDDNVLSYPVFKCQTSAPEDRPYTNYISQTIDITRPMEDLFRIYSLFHFLPGDFTAATASRTDGKMHRLNTTPNSNNAQKVFEKDLASGDLYRIGVGLHTYADTWAHQNFVGYKDSFNSVIGLLEESPLSIGHALVAHSPDQPATIWTDVRLIPDLQLVDNKKRFLEAAKVIYSSLCKFLDRRATESRQLLSDLDYAIGENDPRNEFVDLRKNRYVELSIRPEYGSEELETFEKAAWLDEAVGHARTPDADNSSDLPGYYSPMTDRYFWKSPNTYESSHWHRFQEAVRRHQDETWELLEESVFSKTALRQL